jgi:hypothetical protein
LVDFLDALGHGDVEGAGLAAFPRHTIFVLGQSAGELTSHFSGDHSEVSLEIDY